MKGREILKKIGICTLNEACNMGAILQAFAMQETLSAKEKDILDFKKVSFYNSDYGIYYIYVTKDVEFIVEFYFAQVEAK